MDWLGAKPIAGIEGGLLIGLSASIMLLVLGRIAGISGLAARASGLVGTGIPQASAIAFVAGLPLGAALVARIGEGVFVHMPPSPILLVVAGALVGFGTRLGGGCTSGHGVCGLSRLSLRSLVATATFMAIGMVTVATCRWAGFPW